MIEGGPLGLLLEYRDQRQFFSHEIETHDNKAYNARLMVKISNTNTLIDPLDFRFDGKRHRVLQSDGSLRAADFIGFCYLAKWKTAEDNSEMILEVSEADIKSKQFLHPASQWEVDFPQIVLAYLPDDGKPLYNRLKVMSNYVGGIQSQCAVMQKFKSQGSRKDQ